MNEVDRLQAQIIEIQEKCTHDFETILGYERWIEFGVAPATLQTTKVPNVFIGYDCERRIILSIKFKCKKCNMCCGGDKGSCSTDEKSCCGGEHKM